MPYLLLYYRLELIDAEMLRPEDTIIIMSPDNLFSIILFLQFLHFYLVTILHIYIIVREQIGAIHLRSTTLMKNI